MCVRSQAKRSADETADGWRKTQRGLACRRWPKRLAVELRGARRVASAHARVALLAQLVHDGGRVRHGRGCRLRRGRCRSRVESAQRCAAVRLRRDIQRGGDRRGLPPAKLSLELRFPPLRASRRVSFTPDKPWTGEDTAVPARRALTGAHLELSSLSGRRRCSAAAHFPASAAASARATRPTSSLSVMICRPQLRRTRLGGLDRRSACKARLACRRETERGERLRVRQQLRSR